MLVDVASMLAYGTPMPRSSMSAVDEEMRKQITTMLISGTPAALLDNVKSGGKFGGPAFDALLTSDQWRERNLGRLQSLVLPARCVWFVSGNNLQFVGDLPRRTLRCRLDSPLEDPEDREGFKHGKGDLLLALVERRRKMLVTQCLIILRAHALEERPSSGDTWGSFESWSRVIADPIRWIGLADPMHARVAQDESADDQRLHAHALISVLVSIGKPVTARELVLKLYPPNHYEMSDAVDPDPSYAAARDALEIATKSKGVPSPANVGYVLRALRGRVVNSRSIVSVQDAHSKTAYWSVRGPGGTCPVAP